MKPYLVQRLSRRVPENSGKEGIDSQFQFDYMGSAEFEYGALPTAMREMRGSQSEYLPEPKRIKTENGIIAWFVGVAESYELASQFFRDQLQDRQWRLKERTYIQNAYVKEPDPYACTAWWAIDVEKPWLLFKHKSDAKEWIKQQRKRA